MNNETQADILREMRDLGALDAQCGDMIPRSLQALGLRTYADRIEAAVERERTQRDKVSFRCGDCARFGGDCDAGDSDGNEDRVACEEFVRRALVPGNAAAMRAALKAAKTLLENTDFDADSDLDDAAAPVMAQIAAALSAPPRNCDRYANTAQALGAYPDGPPIGDDWDDADWMMLLDWLFAKAKGGAE